MEKQIRQNIVSFPIKQHFPIVFPIIGQQTWEKQSTLEKAMIAIRIVAEIVKKLYLCTVNYRQDIHLLNNIIWNRNNLI